VDFYVIYGCAVAADMIIAVSMIYYLWKRRTTIQRSIIFIVTHPEVYNVLNRTQDEISVEYFDDLLH